MSSTNEHIAARDDLDLQHRLIAKAEQMGLDNAQYAVAPLLGKLISAPITVNGEETHITKVHAYAALTRTQLLQSDAALPPGQNPSAVTDAHLEAAIRAVVPDVPEATA